MKTLRQLLYIKLFGNKKKCLCIEKSRLKLRQKFKLKLYSLIKILFKS